MLQNSPIRNADNSFPYSHTVPVNTRSQTANNATGSCFNIMPPCIASHCSAVRSHCDYNGCRHELRNRLDRRYKTRDDLKKKLKSEILVNKKELLQTSAQDQFARWAKLRRSVDKGLADLEKLSEYTLVS